MPVYSFELSFTAPSGEAVIDLLYEAGWDDAVVSWDPEVGGPGLAAFDREAPSAVAAVTSATMQGRTAGIELTGITEDLVTLAEIAERSGRTFSTADHWATGRRGPGDFPNPRIRRSRASLYSWAEVASWLAANHLARTSPEDLEIARVCEVTEAMIRAHRLQATMPAADQRSLLRAVA